MKDVLHVCPNCASPIGKTKKNFKSFFSLFLNKLFLLKNLFRYQKAAAKINSRNNYVFSYILFLTCYKLFTI